MRYFIFITTEGYTYQPSSYLSSEPDVENCQVLGFGEGEDEQNAFRNLADNNKWLLDSSFNEVIVYELKVPNSITQYYLAEERNNR